jgi:hypothetical protein
MVFMESVKNICAVLRVSGHVCVCFSPHSLRDLSAHLLLCLLVFFSGDVHLLPG